MDAAVLPIIFAGIAVCVSIYSLHESRKSLKIQTYLSLNQQYNALLWRCAEDSDLNEIWDKLPPEAEKSLEKLRKSTWGVWYSLDEKQRKQYLFVRNTIELFEQAYVANREGFMPEQLWRKWHESIQSWRVVRHFEDIIIDSEDRFDAQFIIWTKQLSAKEGPQAR